jgi:hypothetical protein
VLKFKATEEESLVIVSTTHVAISNPSQINGSSDILQDSSSTELENVGK